MKVRDFLPFLEGDINGVFNEHLLCILWFCNGPLMVDTLLIGHKEDGAIKLTALNIVKDS